MLIEAQSSSTPPGSRAAPAPHALELPSRLVHRSGPGAGLLGLDAACKLAARCDWSTAPRPLDTTQAAENLERAVIARVVAQKADHHQPEKVLVRLNADVNSALLAHGYAGDQRVVRGIVFAAFLTAFYGRAPLR